MQTMKAFIQSGHYLEDQIRERSKKGDKHFFDADTMRFFSSRISELMWQQGGSEDADYIIKPIYFITSEADKGPYKHGGSKRAWTVRVCTADGDISECGYGFQKEPSLNEARKTIKEIMEGTFQN